MAGGGPITSLPPKVLAGLAKSLAGFARMPEAFAQAHIVARGGKAPEEDGLGAVARGRLLKMLSDEVLAEWSEVADDAAADDDARPSRDPPKRASGKKAEAKPASSAETVMTRAVGVVDPGEDSDESDDSGAVGSGLKPSSAGRKEEAARGKPESAARVTQSESSSDASDEDARPSEGSADAPSDTDSYDDSADESDDVSEDDSNWFGKAATEAPPPATGEAALKSVFLTSWRTSRLCCRSRRKPRSVCGLESGTAACKSSGGPPPTLRSMQSRHTVAATRHGSIVWAFEN